MSFRKEPPSFLKPPKPDDHQEQGDFIGLHTFQKMAKVLIKLSEHNSGSGPVIALPGGDFPESQKGRTDETSVSVNTAPRVSPFQLSITPPKPGENPKADLPKESHPFLRTVSPVGPSETSQVQPAERSTAPQEVGEANPWGRRKLPDQTPTPGPTPRPKALPKEEQRGADNHRHSGEVDRGVVHHRRPGPLPKRIESVTDNPEPPHTRIAAVAAPLPSKPLPKPIASVTAPLRSEPKRVDKGDTPRKLPERTLGTAPGKILQADTQRVDKGDTPRKLPERTLGTAPGKILQADTQMPPVGLLPAAAVGHRNLGGSLPVALSVRPFPAAHVPVAAPPSQGNVKIVATVATRTKPVNQRRYLEEPSTGGGATGDSVDAKKPSVVESPVAIRGDGLGYDGGQWLLQSIRTAVREEGQRLLDHHAQTSQNILGQAMERLQETIFPERVNHSIQMGLRTMLDQQAQTINAQTQSLIHSENGYLFQNLAQTMHNAIQSLDNGARLNPEMIEAVVHALSNEGSVLLHHRQEASLGEGGLYSDDLDAVWHHAASQVAREQADHVRDLFEHYLAKPESQPSDSLIAAGGHYPSDAVMGLEGSMAATPSTHNEGGVVAVEGLLNGVGHLVVDMAQGVKRGVVQVGQKLGKG